MNKFYYVMSVLIFFFAGVGCESTSLSSPGPAPIPVLHKPTADFSISNLPASDSIVIDSIVRIENHSSIGATYLWDFGDGFTTTSVNPAHKYDSIGTYTIRLTAMDTGGNAIDTQVVHIYKKTNPITNPYKPTADFSIINLPASDSIVIDSVIRIENHSSIGATYLWDFGDGYTTTTANPTHKYDSFGTYTIRLTVMDTGGNAIDTQVVHICNSWFTGSLVGSWLAVPHTSTIYGEPEERLYLFDGQKCERLDVLGGNTIDKIAPYSVTENTVTIQWPEGTVVLKMEIIDDVLHQISSTSSLIQRKFSRCNYSSLQLPPGWPPIH